jgi:hypothetical protein
MNALVIEKYPHNDNTEALNFNIWPFLFPKDDQNLIGKLNLISSDILSCDNISTLIKENRRYVTNEGYVDMIQQILVESDLCNYLDTTKINLINLEPMISAKKLVKELDDMVYNNEDRVTTLSFLFDQIEDNLLDEKFAFCDYFIKSLDFSKYNASILTGILIITYPWRKKLNNRESFFSKVTEFIKNNYSKEESDEILSGIE